MAAAVPTPLVTLFVSKVTPHSYRPGLSLLDTPHGTRISIQPDGSIQDRPLTSDGGYEAAQISGGPNGGIATFQPVPGAYYPFAWVLVDKL